MIEERDSENASQGATFVIVDERSLNAMLRGPLRIRRSNFRAIYDMLVSDIAEGLNFLANQCTCCLPRQR